MLFPATAAAGPFLVIDTSACVLMVVFAVKLLFEAFVSALDVVAVTVLLATVPFATFGSACTPMVNCALLPLPSSEIVHATVPLLPIASVLQVAAGPVSCVSDMKTMPAGRGSVKAASVAGSGPALESVIT